MSCSNLLKLMKVERQVSGFLWIQQRRCECTTAQTIQLYLQLCLRLINPGCIASLGMEDGAISDAQITASSQWDDNHSPSRARLNTRLAGQKKGGWSSRPCDLNQWLQVDLGSYTIVTRVATQGRNAHDQWVTSYRIEYSNDGVNFHFYQEPGDSSPKVFFTASSALL